MEVCEATSHILTASAGVSPEKILTHYLMSLTGDLLSLAATPNLMSKEPCNAYPFDTHSILEEA
jgi:hypothetical protein